MIKEIFFGGAILVTQVENFIEFKRDHFETHQEMECDLPNPRIGINPYNFVKNPSSFRNTNVQFTSIWNILPTSPNINER